MPPKSLTETGVFLLLCFFFIIIPCWIYVTPRRGVRVFSHALQNCRHSPGSEDCVDLARINLRLKIFRLWQFNRSFKRHSSHVTQCDLLSPRWEATNSSSFFWLLWGNFSYSDTKQKNNSKIGFFQKAISTDCLPLNSNIILMVFRDFSLHLLLSKSVV